MRTEEKKQIREHDETRRVDGWVRACVRACVYMLISVCIGLSFHWRFK